MTRERTDARLSRRGFVTGAARGFGVLALGPSLLHAAALAQAGGRPVVSVDRLGVLGAPDANGIRLPAGFWSRVVARSERRVQVDGGGFLDYRWHIFPDGGATFPVRDGGYIYVSNCEAPARLGGGASALRFDAFGRIVDAYRILADTHLNCAGGPTPWGTWLSCEEHPQGLAYECDVFGAGAQARPALGTFEHEAAAVDPVQGHVYLTEDDPQGRFYRFAAERRRDGKTLDLTAGVLEVASVDESNGRVRWYTVPNPNPARLEIPTRLQVPASTAFDGGEGCWYHDGRVFFTTKGDNRVWMLDTHLQRMSVLYDAATARNPMLTGVDNVTVTGAGQVLVAEDGGDMQIVMLGADGSIAPLLQVMGQEQSEITGPAFDPSGRRLYFSSQRGNAPEGERGGLGITYEISGPFERLTRA